MWTHTLCIVKGKPYKRLGHRRNPHAVIAWEHNEGSSDSAERSQVTKKRLLNTTRDTNLRQTLDTQLHTVTNRADEELKDATQATKFLGVDWI